jgi:hypothetical protein
MTIPPFMPPKHRCVPNEVSQTLSINMNENKKSPLMLISRDEFIRGTTLIIDTISMSITSLVITALHRLPLA